MLDAVQLLGKDSKHLVQVLGVPTRDPGQIIASH